MVTSEQGVLGEPDSRGASRPRRHGGDANAGGFGPSSERGRFARSADRLLTGLYAWGTTVALPLSHRATPALARWSSLVALAALVGGALLLPRAPRWGRILGVGMFTAACAGSWVFGRGVLLGTHLDAWLGALGALGWALFALTWAGRPRGLPTTPAAAPDLGEFGPEVSSPSPRQRLSKGASAVIVLGCLGAASPMMLAWWIPDRARALVGHGAALVGAVGILSVSAKLATEWSTGSVWGPGPKPGPRSVRQVLWKARRPLLVLFVVAAIGAVLLCPRLR